MLIPGVSILPPPYTSLLPFGPEPPTLGSLVTGDVAALHQAQKIAPWCPVCITVSDRPASIALFRVVHELTGCVAYVSARAGEPLDVEALVHAVENRPAPSAVDLAGYVARRTHNRELGSALLTCFENCEDRVPATPAVRCRLSRRLAPSGPLTARDWTAIHPFIGAERSPAYGPERVAYELGMDPRTARARLRRYTGMSLRDVGQRVGWEWFLEAVLRHCQYVHPGESSGTILRAHARDVS